jgi:putative ABC transport system ATP-binding protein
MTKQPMIEIHDLSFAYSAKTDFVLKIPQWSVSEGEKIFLYGPSGSGKTTLLGLLTGILTPSSGSLEISGSKFHELSIFERDRFRAMHIGYVFQQLNLISYLSVKENILISAWNSKSRFQKSRFASPQDEVHFLAKRLEIDSLLDQKPRFLSIGEQQRVALARALMGPPRLLIADEPTSALDDDRQEGFIQLMLELANEFKVSVIFVSHNRRLSHFFDRETSLESICRRGSS